jgi:hypothetical protein
MVFIVVARVYLPLNAHAAILWHLDEFKEL